MTRNKSYLLDYEEIDGGFVAFGGNSKGGKITGKDVARNQTNSNAGTKESIDAGQARKKTIPSHEYILLPLWTPDSPISSSLKSLDDKVADDVEKKSTEEPAKEDEKDDRI
ncbi:hypothetical protein Tco_1093784 [Tanacetum coccineum]|uniref:Uncharacterized protein n=1 Tax=Tanacetum coccineum TaxID=301880 RepID=A0ABQ5IDP5_9ASTR